MVTKKQTISVRLDAGTKRQVERAARLRKQSAGAFLEQAGEAHARHVLLAWALDRHRSDEASFSELAADTGLTVEEIMLAVGRENRLEGLELFLTSCRTVTEVSGDAEFLRLAEEAAQLVRRELVSTPARRNAAST